MVHEIRSVTDRMFCHFGPFLPFYPTNNPKNPNFEKLKKMPGDIITLHNCTNNHDHKLYHSSIWCMDNVTVIFHFGIFFALLTTLTAQKIKIKKKKKMLGYIIILHKVYQKLRSDDAWFLRYGA